MSGLSRRLFLLTTATVSAFDPVGAFCAQATGDEAFVKLGGVDQWVGIFGSDHANPVLLIVHGGPGDVLWPYADKFLPWEKSFTVVLWDQRGAGRSYGHGGDKTPDVRLARIVQDGIELAEHLRNHLNKRKIIVLGHSWGSIVAVEMATARPDLFAAYIGTGQVESWKDAVNFQFDYLLQMARIAKDDATVKELEAIGHPDPANTHQFFTFTRNYRAVMAPADQAWLRSLRPLFQSHKNDKDFQNAMDGMGFSGRSLIVDEVAEDLPARAKKLETAFFIIQGADDVISPTICAINYYNQVTAPVKELVLIPGAGHFAFLTNSEVFLAILIAKVRPLAIARGA